MLCSLSYDRNIGKNDVYYQYNWDYWLRIGSLIGLASCPLVTCAPLRQSLPGKSCSLSLRPHSIAGIVKRLFTQALLPHEMQPILADRLAPLDCLIPWPVTLEKKFYRC